MVDNSPCRRCAVLGSHLEELRSLASKIQGMLSLACADRGMMVDNAKPCWLFADRLFDAPIQGHRRCAHDLRGSYRIGVSRSHLFSH
jgi:hypothetical protein